MSCVHLKHNPTKKDLHSQRSTRGQNLVFKEESQEIQVKVKAHMRVIAMKKCTSVGWDYKTYIVLYITVLPYS